jgi:hypothetical protein
LLLILIGIAVPLRLFWTQRHKAEPDQKPASLYPFPMPRHDIRGFHYAGNHGDKKVIAVTADRLKIEKKKVGLFRFGMLSVARLDNAKIQIFADDSGKKDQTSGSLKRIFSNETLPVLPIKQLSTIEMKPVLIEIHEGETIISAISADLAIVRLTKQDVLLQGHVAVTSGFRTMATDELRLVPDKGVVEVNRPYTLKAGNNNTEGTVLTTDLRLNPIGRQPEKQSRHNNSGVWGKH